MAQGKARWLREAGWFEEIIPGERSAVRGDPRGLCRFAEVGEHGLNRLRRSGEGDQAQHGCRTVGRATGR